MQQSCLGAWVPGCANRRQESVAETLHDAVYHIIAAKTGVWQKPATSQLCCCHSVVCTLSPTTDIVTCMALDKVGTGDHLITGSRDTTCVIWRFGSNVSMYSMCSLCLNVFSVSQCVLRVSVCSPCLNLSHSHRRRLTILCRHSTDTTARQALPSAPSAHELFMITVSLCVQVTCVDISTELDVAVSGAKVMNYS